MKKLKWFFIIAEYIVEKIIANLFNFFDNMKTCKKFVVKKAKNSLVIEFYQPIQFKSMSWNKYSISVFQQYFNAILNAKV